MSNILNSTFIAFEDSETETVFTASGTNGLDSHRDLLDGSASHFITDESLLSTWFAHCDEYGTGQVKASKLVNYIVEVTYQKEAEHKDTLDELYRLLDPTNDNCSVDLPTFRVTLQDWLARKRHHDTTSSVIVYSSSKGFGKRRHSSPRRSPGIMETTSTSLFDCSFEVGLESLEKPVSKTDDPLNHLEYQNKRLQEEKVALQKQLVALEEQNLNLLDKIPELEKILQNYQASFSRMKESEDEVEQYKLLLSAKDKELEDMTDVLRSYEKQEKEYLEEIESLRKSQEELETYKIHELGLTRALKSLQNECRQLERQHQEDDETLQQERQRCRELEIALEQANDFIKVLREEKEDMQLQFACAAHNVWLNPQTLSPDIGMSLTNDVVESKPVACSTPYVNLALNPRHTSIREEFKESEVNVSEVNLPFCGKMEESTFDSHLDNRFINDLQQLLAEKRKFVTNLVLNLDLIRNEHEQTWQHLSNAQMKRIWSQIVSKAVEENMRIDAEYQLSLYRLLDGASSAGGLIPADIEEDAPDDSKALEESNLVIKDNVVVPNGRKFACLRADLVPSPVEEGQTHPNQVPHETRHSIQYQNELGPGSSVGITFAVMMDTSNRNRIYDGGSKSLETPARSRKTGLSIVQGPVVACSSPSVDCLDSLDYLDLEASPELRRRRTRIKTASEEPAGPLSCFYESLSPLGQDKMMINSSRSSQNKADAVQDDQVSTSSSWNITQSFRNCTDSLLIKAGVHTQSPWQPENWTEEDIECKFNLLSLSLRTDHVTLEHRLEILLRKRDVTEQNLNDEMDAFQNTVRSLCASLTTKESAKVLGSLEKQIALLRLLMRKISSVAEVLGAVQQEYRLSRAVDLMLMHVDNLKRRWEKDTKELEEVKLFFEECSDEQVSGLPNLPSLDSPSPATRIRSLSLSEIVRRRTSLGSPTLAGKASSAESKDGRHRAVNLSSLKHLSFSAPLKSQSEEVQFQSKKSEMEKIVESAEEERERQVFAFPDTEGESGDSNNNKGETSSTGGERGQSMTVSGDSSMDQSRGGDAAERNVAKEERRDSRVGETRKLSLNTRLQRWLNTCQMTGKERKGKMTLASPVEQPKMSTVERWVRRHFGCGTARPSRLRQTAMLCRWSLAGVLLLAALASLLSAFAPCFTERWLMLRPNLAEGAYVPFQRLSYASWEDILGSFVKVERLGPVPM